MPMPSYMASILEQSSALEKGQSSHPRMMRYRTSIFPAEAGIDLVITDLEDFRFFAEMEEPRLAVLLTGLCHSIDFGISSRDSENGRMIGVLLSDKNQAKTQQTLTPDQEFDQQMNVNNDKRYDQNRKY